ncbi:MAG: hypothetical protein ACRECY_13690, partial [Phyllobacterium sp.]
QCVHARFHRSHQRICFHQQTCPSRAFTFDPLDGYAQLTGFPLAATQIIMQLSNALLQSIQPLPSADWRIGRLFRRRQFRIPTRACHHFLT